MSEGKLDLAAGRLAPGEGRRFDLLVPVDPIELGGSTWDPVQLPMQARLEASRTLGDGWAFHLTAEARLKGACSRCLAPAELTVPVDAREVDRPGGGEELDSPYLEDEVLDCSSWLRDCVVLAMPSSVLCEPGCPGLCDECGVRLADAGPDHRHEKPPDPRWAALRDLGG